MNKTDEIVEAIDKSMPKGCRSNTDYTQDDLREAIRLVAEKIKSQMEKMCVCENDSGCLNCRMNNKIFREWLREGEK